MQGGEGSQGCFPPTRAVFVNFLTRLARRTGLRPQWRRIRTQTLAKEIAMHRDALSSILPHGGLPVGNAGPHENILRTIGWTPLVRLNRLGTGLQAQVLVKVESANP